MGTEALKSGVITNRDASPVVFNNSAAGGILREAVGTLEVTTSSDAGSTYRFVSVPSNARISQIAIFSDDLGNTITADFGVYRTTADGGAVVDADAFASAVDLNAAALNGTDITYEAATSTAQIDDIEKMLWQQLNLSADPCVMYDVVMTTVGAATSGGTVSLRVRYVV
jgi:hypothetical protein